MNHRLAHNDATHLNAIIAFAGARGSSGRTRSRKILQFKHYCTDAPI